MVCFAAAIALLMYLDYFNIEKIAPFNNIGFLFDYTWKGRLFLFFFFWLFILESFSSFQSLQQDPKRRTNYLKVLFVLVFALIPLFYIIGVNFLGLDQTVIKAGEILRGAYWKANSISYVNTLEFDWPLSIEYVVFALSFLATVLLAYGKNGLRTFSITIAFISVISVVYMIDTLYPYGAFKPLQVFALPTAACAAVLLEAIGIRFSMMFSPGPTSAPVIVVNAQGSPVATSIAWPCAGVHSLFIYTIIVLLLLRKSDMSGFRKLIYFVIGLIGTYSVNVLRIVTYFVLLVNQGKDVALVFHNNYGELYFFAWMLIYILLIVCIQKYKLVEKAKAVFFKKDSVACGNGQKLETQSQKFGKIGLQNKRQEFHTPTPLLFFLFDVSATQNSDVANSKKTNWSSIAKRGASKTS
jgi:thaumarchaeosortase